MSKSFQYARKVKVILDASSEWDRHNDIDKVQPSLQQEKVNLKFRTSHSSYRLVTIIRPFLKLDE